MIKVKDPNQLDIFDPWAFLSPKRRQMLDSEWPGLFREHRPQYIGRNMRSANSQFLA